MKKKIIFTSVMTIVLCLSLIAGSTFALFTSTSSVNIAVTAGRVEVVATVDQGSLRLHSPKAIDMNGTVTDDTEAAQGSTFANGGTATLDENGTLTLSNVTPGDSVSFTIQIENRSNVNILYRTSVSGTGDRTLLNSLNYNVGGATSSVGFGWTELEAEGSIDNILCTVTLPADAGNDCQNKQCAINFTIEAVQGNVDQTIRTNGRVGTTYNGSDKNVTLNSYRFEHTFDNGVDQGMVIYVTNGASVTLEDVDLTGTVTPDTGLKNMGFFVYNGSKLTINSGNYELNGKWGNMIWAQGGSSANRNTITINGGNFKVSAVYETGDNKYSTLVSAYSDTDVYITGGFFDLSAANPNVTLQWRYGSTMTVTGGTFVNYDPAAHNCVPTGYQVQSAAQADGTTWYTVVASAD